MARILDARSERFALPLDGFVQTQQAPRAIARRGRCDGKIILLGILIDGLYRTRSNSAFETTAPASIRDQGQAVPALVYYQADRRGDKVLVWLARHPRWTFHFTPTSASWLNAVENFFSKMTRQRIRRGVFRSIADLQAAINSYLAEHNTNPKPFVWTKSAEAILAKLDRCPVPSV